MKQLIGRKIVGVQHMSQEMADQLGWYCRPVILILDDESILVPQSDDEGNNGGAVMHYAETGDTLLYTER
jgi:hypothetical protein